jgi:hypothetical protein
MMKILRNSDKTLLLLLINCVRAVPIPRSQQYIVDNILENNDSTRGLLRSMQGNVDEDARRMFRKTSKDPFYKVRSRSSLNISFP